MKRLIAVILFVLARPLFVGAEVGEYISFSGKTMGTTWSATVAAPDRLKGSASGRNNQSADARVKIERIIVARLDRINQSMSAYRRDSELSRFNSWKGGPFLVSTDMMEALMAGWRLHRLTQGAWDGSIKPLVDLWGFGASGSKKRMPSRAAIKRTLASTGFQNIKRVDDRHVLKQRPDIEIDLGSMAKGYAADRVARDLRENGFDDFIVEIGGEVYASGVGRDGAAWKAGVNSPVRNIPFDHIYKVVALRDMALATSGDYRIFFNRGDRFYSHILDPKTGRPIKNNVASVSVIAQSGMLADGLATAMLVMGAKKGIELAESLAGVECMVIERKKDGFIDYYTDHYSTGFQSFVIRP